MKKILGINTIFQREKDGSFTGNALLYQDILLYPLKTNYNEFRLYDLGYWLIKNNNEFSKARDLDLKYSSKKHTTVNYELEKRKERISERVKDLMQLDLIRIKGKVRAKKGPYPVDLFYYTTTGYITAYFIARFGNTDKYKRKVATDKIYELIISAPDYFQRSYKNIFQYKFLTRCKETGLFDKILDSMENLLTNTRLMTLFNYFSTPRSIFSLLELSVLDIYVDKGLKSDIWKTCVEIINSLDKKGRQILLFYEKMALEDMVVKNGTKEWEEVRLKNIKNVSKVTLVGSCSVCIKSYPVVIDYFEYKNSELSSSTPNYITTDCQRCNNKDCLRISKFEF